MNQSVVGKLKLKTHWLSRSSDLEYEASGPNTVRLLSRSINGVLTRPPIAPLLVKQQELIDEKGLDVVLSNGVTDGSQIVEIEGSFEPDDEEGGEQIFKASLGAVFERFEGSSHIIHKTQIVRSGAVPETIPFSQLGKIFPVTPHRIEVGLERFKTQVISTLFGATPVADLRFRFTADKDNWHFAIAGEALPKSEWQPWQKFPSLDSFQLLLKDCLGFDLKADLSAQLPS